MVKEIDVVFILSNHLKYGGAERQSVYLAHILSKHIKVIYIVWDGTKTDSSFVRFVKNHIDHIEILKGNNNLSKIFNMINYSKKFNKPVVVSYLATTNFLNGIIKIFNNHAIAIGGIRSSIIKSKFKLFIQKNFHNYLLNWTVTNNHEVLGYLEGNGFKMKKISVIENCVQKVEDVKIDYINNEIFTIVTLTRLVERKGLYTALHVMRRLKNCKPKIVFKYLLIGSGEMYSYLKNMISFLGLKHECEIIKKANIHEILKNSDVYLSTSLIEGTSNSILEAMAHGLPVVATDAGDNRRLIRHGKNGFVTEIKDVKKIAEHLKILYMHPSMRESFGKQSAKIVNEDYSFDKFEKKYIALINQLAK